MLKKKNTQFSRITGVATMAGAEAKAEVPGNVINSYF